MNTQSLNNAVYTRNIGNETSDSTPNSNIIVNVNESTALCLEMKIRRKRWKKISKKLNQKKAEKTE